LAPRCYTPMADKNLCKYEPLSKDFTYLSRLYYGAVSNKLNGLEIERYYYTLILIKEAEGKLTQKELSGRICSDKVFTVKILDYLAEKGMIRREVNEKDRREHFLSLTAKGEKLIPTIAKAYNDTTTAVLKGVKKEEKEIYFKVIGQMKANLLALPTDDMKINFKKVKKSSQ
jgi:MarR family transcriptional regulator, transcriptional regulator for hemolysin